MINILLETPIVVIIFQSKLRPIGVSYSVSRRIAYIKEILPPVLNREKTKQNKNHFAQSLGKRISELSYAHTLSFVNAQFYLRYTI